MSRNFSLAIVKWDQKEGGVLEYAFPKMHVSNNTAMNLYNMANDTTLLRSLPATVQVHHRMVSPRITEKTR